MTIFETVINKKLEALTRQPLSVNWWDSDFIPKNSKNFRISKKFLSHVVERLK